MFGILGLFSGPCEVVCPGVGAAGRWTVSSLSGNKSDLMGSCSGALDLVI